MVGEPGSPGTPNPMRPFSCPGRRVVLEPDSESSGEVEGGDSWESGPGGALWVWLCPAGDSLHSLMQSLAPSKPQGEPRRRVTFLLGPMGTMEGMGRGMTQLGGLRGSGDEGPERGEQRLEASLALERNSEVSGSGGQWEGKETVGSDGGTGISDLTRVGTT